MNGYVQSKNHFSTRLFIGLVLALAMLLCVLPAADAKADVVGSGTCGAQGDNLTWTLDDEGLLTISGTGAMADYYPSSHSGFGVMTKVNVGHVAGDPDDYYALGVTMLTAEGKATYYNTDIRYNVGLEDEYVGDRYLGWLFNYNISASGKFVVGTVDDNTRMLTEPDFGFVGGNDTGFVPLCPAGNRIEAETDKRGILSNDAYQAIDAANVEIEGMFADYLMHSSNAMKITEDTVIYEITAYTSGAFKSAALGDPADYIGVAFTADQISIFAWDDKNITVLFVVNPFSPGPNDGSAAPAPGEGGDESAPGNGSEVSDDFVSGTNAGRSLSLGETRRDMAKSGDGEEQDAPWASMRSSIERVVIEDGVTAIGANAFAYCENLSELTLPASVTSIGDNAFSGCDSLGEVRFGGTEEQWEAIDLGYGNDILYDVVPQSVYAVEGGYIYFAPDTGQITGCDASVTSAVIPSSINGVDVTSIGEYAFDGCNNLTDVIIHAGLLSIGGYAFSNCDSLTNISIPDSVSDIGIFAFYNCTSLTSVALPNGTFVSIEEGVFEGCSSLTSVIIPASVTSIDDCAFYDCGSLTGLTIPNNMISIGEYAFNWCSSLTSVTIPASVTFIGVRAFGECDSLTSINVDGDNAEYCSIDGVLFNKDATELILYPRGKSGAYTIPDSVSVIVDMAFTDCYRLNNITIPNSVIRIGESAFENTRITNVTIPASVTEIGEGAFDHCRRLMEINVDSENTVYSSLNGLLLNKNGDTLISCPAGIEGEFSIPAGIKTIGALAFSRCNGITSVTIPDGVTGIGNCAFLACDGLTSVTIPGSVNEIGPWAFEGCENLTSVTIQGGVSAIANGAFIDCNNLSSVVIPTTVTRIGYDAFTGCNRLNVYYTGDIDDWDGISMDPDDYDFLSGRLHLNYVENELTVSVDQSGDNWYDGELYVPIGGDAELKVIASAKDGDLSYRWVKECEGDSIVEEWMDSTDATLAISNVTEDALYICYVEDMYGTQRYAAICVRAGEVFSVSRVGDSDIYVSPGGSASLQVSVNAGDLSEVEYEWECGYYDAEIDSYRWQLLDGENGDSYTVTNADKSVEYFCHATRRVCDYDNVLSDGLIDERYETYSVYFHVYIDNSFNAWAASAANIKVTYGETATLEVQTSAIVNTGITYEWTQRVFDTAGDYYDEIPVGGNSATLTTPPVTQYCEYICDVRDIYGNREWVWFDVGVDNDLSVDIDRTIGGRWEGYTLYVSAGAPAEVNVLADATDTDGLEYQWQQFVYYDDGNGDWISLSNDTSTLTLDAVTYYAEYRCRVIDRYGNYDYVWVSVSVDNNLSVAMSSNVGDLDGDRLYVSPGEDVTLTVTATADVMDGITYEWDKEWRDENGKWHREDLQAGPDNTMDIGPVNRYGEYYCIVRDQYGNTQQVWCMVSVDNDFSARAKGETTLLVPFNATPTLEVEVSGNDIEDVSYFWYKVDYTYSNDGYWQGGETVFFDNNTHTLVADPVTTRCIYYCTVRDRFDNTEHIDFEVGVDNDFIATVDGTDKTYVQIEVPAGETASLKVKAEADDSDDITYRWYSITPPTDENGDPIPVATGSDLQLIDGSGLNDTLEVKATKSKMYFSRVIDKFANMVEVFFHVKVANDLAVTPEEENITVPSGSDQTLTVTPSALDDEGIRYSWQKASYNDQGEFWGWWNGFGSGQSLTLENLTAPISYRCQVTDKYDNTVFSVFNISLTYGDEGDVQVEVDPGVVDEEVVFVAELLAEADIPAAAPENAVVYDLYFENEEDERVQPSGAVTVSIPVPEGMTGSKCKVYYIDGDQLTDMHATYEADNAALTFTADHFSYYAVVEDSGHTVTLEDRTNGAATISGIVAGENTCSGETAFNVTCAKACAVLYTTDGENYTRLVATATNDGCSFTVNVEQDMTIIVAMKGDINSDGKLDIQDVAMIKAAQLNKITISTLQRMIVDVNADNRLDIQDVAMTKAAQLNKISLGWDI